MDINLIGGALLNYLYNNLLTHFPSHIIRRSFLRLFNKNIDSSAVILMHTRLLNFWNIEIGERVIINQYCLLDNRRYKITISSDTDIGPYTKIWTLGHDPNSEFHDIIGGDVHIGHHVWIASGVTILPGIRLANGTVVGADSLLSRSTNELDIVVGNPAKFIKKRLNSLTYQLRFTPLLE